MSSTWNSRAGHDDVAKNSRVVVGRNAMYVRPFFLANPRHLLCRLDIPGVGVVEESNTVVAVNRINQDVRLPILICKVTRLGEYHRIPRFQSVPGFGVMTNVLAV